MIGIFEFVNELHVYVQAFMGWALALIIIWGYSSIKRWWEEKRDPGWKELRKIHYGKW